MGAWIVLEKPGHELCAVDAAVVPELPLRQHRRWCAGSGSHSQRRAKNRDLSTIHVLPPEEFSIDETGANDMPFPSFARPCPPHEIVRTSQCQNSPARHLNLTGASNFRDLGGYPTSDGRIVRWRQIFRSNHLGHLTDDDIAVMRRLGVRSAFDFRGTEERTAALCGMPDIAVHSLPVEPTVVAALRAIAASGTPLTTDHAADVMRDSYRSYVQDNTPRYRTLFAHLWKIAHRW